MTDWIPLRPSASLISDYGLLSNCRASALVSRGGSVDWACMPRFDSPAMFARLLGEPGGYFSIAPTEPAESRRAYLEDTMVLRTDLRTRDGIVRLTDFLALDPDDRGNDIGLRAPARLCRLVEGVDGEVDLDVEIAVRPEFGLTTPLLQQVARTAWRTRGGPIAVTVSTDAPVEARGAVLAGRFAVVAGRRCAFVLDVGDAWGSEPQPQPPDIVHGALEATIDGWRSWAEKLHGYDGEHRPLLRRSALVLRALNYAPTGAIVAAPTTSLPEEIGGIRNWDYRYTWVRDASLTIGALAASGCGFEATRFFDFFVTATAGSLAHGQGLQIMYGIRGERHLPEDELHTLTGHRGSRPVRIGNGAWNQTQLDVFGELLDAAWKVAQLGVEIDAQYAAFLANVADRAALRWRDSDDGIWEVRGGAGHFVYSKLMNWVALDRACQFGATLAAPPKRVRRWARERDQVRHAILDQGWSNDAGAFTQAFGRDDLDASVLMMPIVGFLDANEPRMRATIEAVAARLTDEHGFVFRYLGRDGLPGREGTFGICTFWLAQCLALAGEIDRAESLFKVMADAANDLGLLAEEVDPVTREPLGNFPQAFTHIGLINAARAIDAQRALLG